MKINAFTMRYEIWKGREKKSSAEGGIEPLVDRVKKDMTCDLPPAPLDVSSNQRWVIYSQTNGAVSNYTYLFRFVWIVVVFSDLLFCFRICHCVFWLVIMFSGLLLCFLNCYFVFYICICVCNLLFCFQNCVLFCTCRPPYTTLSPDFCPNYNLEESEIIDFTRNSVVIDTGSDFLASDYKSI